MTWLSDWAKRIKLTISGSYIEGDLSDFPIMIHLDSTCSGVFNELGGNNKRIAVTASGQQQCYIEIEDWNESTNSAWLWVKVPTLSSGISSDVYLYYDNLRSDNSAYVGTVGETAAQNVWDNNFVGVWHMNQNPTGGSNCIKDSTSNTNNGTPGGSMTSGDLVDGKVGKALDFDGNDRINVGDKSSLEPSILTLECLVKPDDYTRSLNGGIAKGWLFGDGAEYSYKVNFHNSNASWSATDTSNAAIFVLNEAIGDNNYHYWAGIYKDGLGAYFYKDGDLVGSNGSATGAIDYIKSCNDFLISARSNGSHGLIGDMDEIRVSDTNRSAPWVKATYYSSWNQLINYGNEETIPHHCFSGVVKVENVLSIRKVNLYDQSTGELINYTTSSSGTGAWSIDVYGDISDKCFAVCVPESDNRNAEVFANLTGV